MRIRTIIRFFDKLEDKVRGKLSHYPIAYAFTAGVGVVFFWRGVWHTADLVMEKLFSTPAIETAMDLSSLPWWDGPLSIIFGTVVLLMSGSFISNFIGNEIIISGLRGEKKLTEKTETEVRTEASVINEIKQEVKEIVIRLKKIEEETKIGLK